jgi:hypothetical protein
MKLALSLYREPRTPLPSSLIVMKYKLSVSETSLGMSAKNQRNLAKSYAAFNNKPDVLNSISPSFSVSAINCK